jgi:hypothetical protein
MPNSLIRPHPTPKALQWATKHLNRIRPMAMPPVLISPLKQLITLTHLKDHPQPTNSRLNPPMVRQEVTNLLLIPRILRLKLMATPPRPTSHLQQSTAHPLQRSNQQEHPLEPTRSTLRTPVLPLMPMRPLLFLLDHLSVMVLP